MMSVDPTMARLRVSRRAIMVHPCVRYDSAANALRQADICCRPLVTQAQEGRPTGCGMMQPSSPCECRRVVRVGPLQPCVGCAAPAVGAIPQ